MLIKHKTCIGCKKIKKEKEFYTRGVEGRDWLKSECKKCSTIRCVVWQTKNRKRYNLYQKLWHRIKYRKSHHVPKSKYLV